MKNLVFVIFASLSLSCSLAEDGDFYVEYVMFGINNLQDNNPDTPDVIELQTLYKTYKGTYTTTWVDDYTGETREITYTVKDNEYSKGGIFTPGKDTTITVYEDYVSIY